jgi:hypothetical protein
MEHAHTEEQEGDEEEVADEADFVV